MTFWPFGDISAIHPAHIHLYTKVDIVVGFFVSLCTIVFAVITLGRFTKAKGFALCFFISLIPVLNILPLTIGNSIGHERFLALPLVFASFLVANFRLPKQLKISDSMSKLLKYGLPILFVFWCLLCFMTIRSTSPLWTSSLSFWTWNYKKNPQDPIVIDNYLGALLEIEDTDSVKKVLNESDSLRELEERHPLYKIKIGIVRARLLFLENKYDESVIHLINLIDGIDDNQLSHLTIKDEDFGKVSIKKNTYKLTVVYVPLFQQLAQAQYELGKYKDSLRSLQIAEVYDSSLSYLHYLKALNYIKLHQFDKAKLSMENVVESNQGLDLNLLIREVRKNIGKECSKSACNELIEYIDKLTTNRNRHN